MIVSEAKREAWFYCAWGDCSRSVMTDHHNNHPRMGWGKVATYIEGDHVFTHYWYCPKHRREALHLSKRYQQEVNRLWPRSAEFFDALPDLTLIRLQSRDDTVNCYYWRGGDHWMRLAPVRHVLPHPIVREHYANTYSNVIVSIEGTYVTPNHEVPDPPLWQRPIHTRYRRRNVRQP